MKIIDAADAPAFDMPGVRFTGLAAPSRGARETAAWRIAVEAGTPARFHQVTREEIFIATGGRARFHIGGREHELVAGGCAIVPPNVDFALSNPFDAPFEAVVVFPVGGQAMLAGEAPFVPPWAA